MSILVEYGLAICLGIIVAILNSLAGGGSSLSLPAFIFMGLPPGIANGTNRFGLIWGNFFSFYGLYKKGQFDFKTFKPVILPIVLGASVGAYLVVQMPDKIFEGFLAIVLLGVAGLNIFHLLNWEKRKTKEAEEKNNQPTKKSLPSFVKSLKDFGLFVLVGFYGGFVQVGVGFVMIYAFSRWSSANLLQINAIKSGVATLFMLISFGIFLAYGKVQWDIAFLYASGCICGGYMGSVVQVRKGEGLVKWVMVLVCIAMSLKLLWKFI